MNFFFFIRLYGSYEALKGGKTSEAMVDFTGGLVETIDFSKKEQTDKLFEKMLKFQKSNSFMSCSIRLVFVMFYIIQCIHFFFFCDWFFLVVLLHEMTLKQSFLLAS